MTEPEGNIPNLIAVGAQAVVANASALGLTWTRRLASTVDTTTPAQSTVLVDGDTAVSGAVSMIGEVPAGSRVYIDFLPPGGAFIVGLVGGIQAGLFGAVNSVGASVGGNTTSATYVNMPGPVTITLPKSYVDTRVRVDVHVSLFSTVGTTAARVAVGFNSLADGDVVNFFFNTANVHTQISGTAIFPFAFAGSLPLTLRWRRVLGTGTITQDTNDWISFTAQEVI